MLTLRLIVQAIAVCGLATFAGFLLTVALTLVPYWKGLTTEAFLTAFGQLEGPLQTSVGASLAPSLLGVVGSVLLTWNSPGSRWLWLAAAGCLIFLLTLTGRYFLPANRAFTERQVPPAKVAHALETWSRVHWLRVVLALTAAVLGAVALSQPTQLIGATILPMKGLSLPETFC